MEKVFEYVADLLWDIPLIVAILSTGIYFTLSGKFFQIKYFSHICKNTFGSILSKRREDKRDGALYPFEAFFMALGATVGVGNITGVATAIILGGPGAIFWMWISAAIGMIIKTAEVTLAVYYRHEDADGHCFGSPMDYIEKGIGKSMNFRTWIIPVVIFSVGIMSTFFITLQNYDVSRTIQNAFNINIITVSLVYAALTYIAIYKGIKGYSRFATKLIPIVCFLYIGAGIIVLVKNYYLIIPCLITILREAFNFESIFGGLAGRGIMTAMRQGVSRAVFSNEAGWGTSPMLHSATNTDHPVKQGIWGAVEVFFDTIVICSTTALVIAVSGLYYPGASVYDLIIKSFATGIGDAAKFLIPATIFIFGLTTSIGWYAYYEVILRYFSRKTNIKVDEVLKYLKLLYPLPGIMMVLYVNNFGNPADIVWYIAEITAGIPTFINIFSILILSNKFFELLDDYKAKYIDNSIEQDYEVPVFYWQEKEYYDDLE